MTTTTALEVAQSSPFPISSGGDGVMFAFSLFAFVAISCVLTMRALAIGRQLWIDRSRSDRVDVMWNRLSSLTVCLGGLTLSAPLMVYKIGWGEVSTETLHSILIVKEWSSVLALMLFVTWTLLSAYFEVKWTLKLSNPLNRVWGGDAAQVKRFGFVVLLSGLLAGSIALSKSFS